MGATLVRAAAVTAFFALVIILVTWPLAADISSTTGAHHDALFSTWRLAWIAHALTTPATLFDTNIFYPEQTTLAFSDAILLPGLLTAPFLVAGANPLVVYNVALLGWYLAAALGAYWLCFRLSGSPVGAAVGALLFSVSTHQMWHFDHLEMQTGVWMPLTLLSIHQAARTGSRKYWVLAGCLAAAQTLSSIYYGIFLIFYLPVFILALLFDRRRELVIGTAVVLGIALLALSVYTLPYQRARSQVGERDVQEVARYSATPQNFLSSHRNNVLYGRFTSGLGSAERHMFPGAVALGLVIAGLFGPWSRTKTAYACGGAVALVLTLGTNTVLFQALFEWLPPVRALRSPARAAILVNLSLAVFASCGAAVLLRRLTSARARRAVSALILGVAIVEYLTTPSLRYVEQPGPIYRYLSRQPPAVLFEFPVSTADRLDRGLDAVYMFNSIVHWHSMVNGYSGFYPLSYIRLLEHMRAFPDPEALDYLRRREVTHILVHSALLSEGDTTLERLADAPGVKLLIATRRIMLFQLEH